MKFSILVPVYNVEEYLVQCIESILRQTYTNYELILVDDGSKDRSGAICDKYAESNPEKIRVIHKENQGLISARRVGIAEAKGDFCIFVDSDDFVELDLLENIHKSIITDSSIDILLYSFSYYIEGKFSKPFRSIAENDTCWYGAEKKELYRKLITTSDITSLCTKAIRTTILKKDTEDYSKYYGKNMAEDLLQSLHPMMAARKVKYIQKSLYNYRIVNESTSHQTSLESVLKMNTIHVYEKILKCLSGMGLNDEETKKQIAAKWFNDTLYLISRCYEDANDYKERKRIVDYDWTCMLPEDVQNTRNEYENNSYQSLYQMLVNRKHCAVRLYFVKKKLYSIWKKRKLKRNEN